MQVCCLKGQRSSAGQPSSYDGVHIVNHYTGGSGVGEPFHSSDDEDSATGAGPAGGPLRGVGPGRGRVRLQPNLDDTDSDGENDDGEALRLSLPSSVPHKSTTV